MKLLPAFLVVLIVLLVTALIYQFRQRTEIESALTALSKDRDDIHAQLQKLDRLVVEQQKRSTTSSSPTEAPRTERATSIPVPPSAAPVAKPGVTITAPSGWSKNGSKPGSYVVGVDQLQTWGGMPSAYVKSLESSVDGFGGMMQTTAAENFIGKRVRLSGWIKTEDANAGGGHL